LLINWALKGSLPRQIFLAHRRIGRQRTSNRTKPASARSGSNAGIRNARGPAFW
jgi:hypothetical protein